jgi:hypothetical protein
MVLVILSEGSGSDRKRFGWYLLIPLALVVDIQDQPGDR